jgi:Family of unknown function (DUF5678)
MQTTIEQVIEAASHLSSKEIHELGKWIREKESLGVKTNAKNAEVEEKIRKFKLAMKWIAENRNEYLGQWVCLDGNQLISCGKDGTKVYQEAIAKRIESPFMEFIKEEDTHYLGGWEKCP